MDFFGKLCLLPADQSIVILILTFGYFSIKREAFERAFFIVAFTLAFNVFLKSIFKVPLPEAINSGGWALPSGHTQLAFVLWGWLAWEYRKWWAFGLFSVACIAEGYGLMYFGYHEWIDLLVAIGFGIMTLVGYHFLLKLKLFLGKSLRLGGFFLIVTVSIALSTEIPGDRNIFGMLAPGMLLLGFFVGLFLTRKLGNKLKVEGSSPSILRKRHLAIALVGIAGLVAMDVFLSNLYSKNIAKFLVYACLGIWVSYGVECVLALIVKNFCKKS